MSVKIPCCDEENKLFEKAERCLFTERGHCGKKIKIDLRDQEKTNKG